MQRLLLQKRMPMLRPWGQALSCDGGRGGGCSL